MSGLAPSLSSLRQTSSRIIRVIGMPGAFAEWGLSWVCQILAHYGAAPRVVPLAEAAPDWHVGFGNLPAPTPPGGRDIVFLDSLARAVGALLMQRTEPSEVARDLTGTLAPLAGVLRGPGALLVRRGPTLDLAATRRAIARHLLPEMTPPQVAMPCESALDFSSPEPRLSGQALALTRQVLAPMLSHATARRDANDLSAESIIWPLCCFYSGDRPDEQAPPIMDTTGPARVLYYGPYFQIPAGRWRVDIQLLVTNDVPAAMFAAEFVGADTVARVEFRPRHGGLFQASTHMRITRPGERIEMRLHVLGGTISGQLGLRQVLMTPLPEPDPTD